MKEENKRLEKIERLLKYILIYLHNSQKDYIVGSTYVKVEKYKLPDISDITKGLGIFK